MTVSSIPPEFIERLRDKNPLTQKEIEQAIEYADISDLSLFGIRVLAEIVIRKEFYLNAQSSCYADIILNQKVRKWLCPRFRYFQRNGKRKYRKSELMLWKNLLKMLVK